MLSLIQLFWKFQYFVSALPRVTGSLIGWLASTLLVICLPPIYTYLYIHLLFYEKGKIYSKTCVKGPLSKGPKKIFKTDYCLMQVKSLTECSKGSILQYFRPSLSYQFSLRPLLYPPQTLFVVGILFSRCPSVRPSVRRFVSLISWRVMAWFSSNLANMFIYARQIL